MRCYSPYEWSTDPFLSQHRISYFYSLKAQTMSAVSGWPWAAEVREDRAYKHFFTFLCRVSVLAFCFVFLWVFCFVFVSEWCMAMGNWVSGWNRISQNGSLYQEEISLGGQISSRASDLLGTSSKVWRGSRNNRWHFFLLPSLLFDSHFPPLL